MVNGFARSRHEAEAYAPALRRNKHLGSVANVLSGEFSPKPPTGLWCGDIPGCPSCGLISRSRSEGEGPPVGPVTPQRL